MSFQRRILTIFAIVATMFGVASAMPVSAHASNGFPTVTAANSTPAANFAWSVSPAGINTKYNAAAVSGTTGRLDGPGWNAGGTGSGITGGC